METITFKIRGESQLLMHNGQLADPLNPYTKAMKSLTSKRKKTDSEIISVGTVANGDGVLGYRLRHIGLNLRRDSRIHINDKRASETVRKR
jgi:hypothetical protein